MAIVDRVSELVLPLLEPMGLSLYDVELNGGNLRVTVDGPEGVQLDALAELTRALSRELDEHDPIPGAYTLEVSSPGLERRLRTPAHFAGAIGEEVTVKLAPHVEGDRRIRGTLASADEHQIAVVDDDDVRHDVDLADVTKASTVFDWSPAPKPGSPGGKKKGGRQQPTTTDQSDRRAAIR